MENEGLLARSWRNISDKIQDQSWFQPIKTKWDELDSRAKTFLKYTALFGSIIGGTGLVGTSLYTVATMKNEIDEKLSLIQKIQGSQDELRKLKDITSRFGGADTQPWAEFLKEKAQSAGLEASSIEIAPEVAVGSNKAKEAGKKDPKAAVVAGSEGPEEAIIEISLKKINVRHLVKYVHEIENGGRTVKVRRLQVTTAPDESGYLDANATVSAFRMRQ